MKDVDFIDLDNNDPPQLWAWAGEPGDETSEPLFRLPSKGILQRFLYLEKECARLDEECSHYSQLARERGEWIGRLEAAAHDLRRVLTELEMSRKGKECLDDCSVD